MFTEQRKEELATVLKDKLLKNQFWQGPLHVIGHLNQPSKLEER